MSRIKDGGPAFPTAASGSIVWQSGDWSGMTLRDWFAGMALSHMGNNYVESATRYEEISRDAYMFADAMLKAREPK